MAGLIQKTLNQAVNRTSFPLSAGAAKRQVISALSNVGLRVLKRPTELRSS